MHQFQNSGAFVAGWSKLPSRVFDKSDRAIHLVLLIRSFQQPPEEGPLVDRPWNAYLWFQTEL